MKRYFNLLIKYNFGNTFMIFKSVGSNIFVFNSFGLIYSSIFLIF